MKFTVGGTTKLPDLVVTSMTVTTSKTGGVFKISVCNQGTASSAKTSYLWLFANLASKPGANGMVSRCRGLQTRTPLGTLLLKCHQAGYQRYDL